MGLAKQLQIEWDERLAQWQFEAGLEICPSCTMMSLDLEKSFCPYCGLSVDDAWRDYLEDDSR